MTRVVVPAGTTVTDRDTGVMLGVMGDGDELVVARGGAGGVGSSTLPWTRTAGEARRRAHTQEGGAGRLCCNRGGNDDHMVLLGFGHKGEMRRLLLEVG